MKDTPLMRQYTKFKRQYPDKIVLFRMGDFFETFGDDAKKTAKILNITLTKRNKNDDPTPLAGFPHHALDQYLPKLIQNGQNAVIVDQVEDPKQSKGLVKRAVTRIVTPGTLDSDQQLSQKNQFIMSVFPKKDQMGICLVDIYTGQLKITQLSNSQDTLQSVINSFEPVEIVLLSDEASLQLNDIPVQFVEKDIAKIREAAGTITEHFKVKNIESLGFDNMPEAAVALAMILEYINETQKIDPAHIKTIDFFNQTGTMLLDQSTIRNLELTVSTAERIGGSTASNSASLLSIIDECETSMGKRLLRQWILNPLTDTKKITKRQDIVEYYFENYQKTLDLRDELSEVNDIARIAARIGLNRANAKDLKALELSLNTITKINFPKDWKDPEKFIKPILPLIKEINQTISEDPPPALTEGKIIKEGFDKEVDELRSLAGNSKDWIKEFTKKEREETGIPSLKIASNKVFGYYIEVTKTHQDKVPEHYIRKQTLVNSERYITEKLKKQEEIILGAEEKLAELEYNLFQEFREKILKYLEPLKELSYQIAKLDILSNFAFVAQNYSYCRPEIFPSTEKNGKIEVIEGRHPVIEQVSHDQFIPNDILIDTNENRLSIITGPNMSGKSTYIRQVAVLVLLAQIGSFIPAKSARISIADRIFTRVGAHDDLGSGRSTFMVEMDEAANIVNNATKNSLVILDEIGRGTSTYDGVSIAWAISEYLLEKVKARTLFATHYHELLKMQDSQEAGVKNYNIAIEEDDKQENVTFLRKIVEGGTDKSYGIYVAKMAGLPDLIIQRSRQLLETFEQENMFSLKNFPDSSNAAGNQPKETDQPQNTPIYPSSLFGSPDSEIEKKLSKLDIENLTPVEALKLLADWKKSLDK
ncbi:DNA mismatch repair protein MutS [Candidatus Dojkabacteria bacterium]|nr:DNA mismatch repair protein MutS [Candidatus Dojkabacteria bacterium]